MGLTVKNSGDHGPRELPAEGTHIARCVQLIDLGHQLNERSQKWLHKVLIGWELPEEKRDDGTPHMVWGRYTMSLFDSAYLRRDLKSWRGRDFTAAELECFDLKTIVGAPCLLNITHSKSGERTYANVSGVLALTKGMTVPDQISESIIFDLDEWNATAFDQFSEHLQATINSSRERREARANGQRADMPDTAMGAADQVEDDDIPF